MSAFLRVRGVSKRFGATQALREVTLDVGEDELLVVLGPTGAGKTTLLRTIAGLETPDKGTIEMAGQDVTRADPAARDIALVFQNFSLYPRWSVRKNLEFPLRAPGRNLAENEIQRRVSWAADLLKISRHLERSASRLSGGEMQRVAIGRAIVRRPRLFLMDEPLTNLDAKLREALRVELLELRRELGIPMVFVTHDQTEALSMAERVVVLSGGKVLQTGTPQQIYENPSSPLVALQLGQPKINLLPVERSEGFWCTRDGTPLVAAADGAGDRALLGIRPEHIAPEGGSHDGVTRVVEYMGPTTMLVVRFAGSDLHVVIRGRSDLPALRARATQDRRQPRRVVSRITHTGEETMTVRKFEPQFMKLGVLTAALQELTPRSVRDPDPDRAIEDWLQFAREIGSNYVQLSAALHPTESDVPAEAMLDPVANTLDLRAPFDATRRTRVEAAMKETKVGISDLAYFDNLLHDDRAIREKKLAFMRRVFDAAALLGVEAVCGFIGRDQKHTMDQNLEAFETVFIPLLKEAKSRGIRYRVEQCPMPGWTTGDNFHNNIGYAPGAWIALHRICDKHGVGDQFRIHYDPSHAILMGQDTRSIFQLLKDTGYGFLIDGFHVKGQVIDAKGVSEWGYGGQTLLRGDWQDGRPSENPADQLNAWKKQTVLCEHELPGTARHDPLAYLQNRTVDWLDHQLAARELLPLDVKNTFLIVEHEYGPARTQDKEKLRPILQGSLAFTRKIDEAAACMFALQNEVLPAQGIPVQGHGRQAYRS